MKSTMHVLHIILTLLTGFWIIIYIWRLFANAQYNRQLEYSNQRRQTEAMERLLANQEAADKLKIMQKEGVL